MTPNEIIEAIKQGKELQSKSSSGSLCVPFDRLLEMLTEEGLDIRIKTEPEIIPWTADDWREFKDIKLSKLIVEKPKSRMSDVFESFDKVRSWSDTGIYFETPKTKAVYFHPYDYLATIKDSNGKPCGKEKI